MKKTSKIGLNELKKMIKEIVIKEMNSTASSGAGGTLPGSTPIMTPYAFKKKQKRKKLFEDIINKADFDLKFSDQAKELMDYIQGSEKMQKDLENTQELFDKMQQDNVFTKEEAFKVYKEFVERAARQFVKDNNENIPADEYFLRKDLLDIIYYNLNKLEQPQPDINAPQGGVQPQGGEVPPVGGEETGGVGAIGAVGAPPAAGAPTGELPPAGGEAGAVAPPAVGAEAPPAGGEVPPAGAEGEEENAPKPEEIAELKGMVKEIYDELNEDTTDESVEINNLENLRSLIIEKRDSSIKNNRPLAIQLNRVAKYIDNLQDKIATRKKRK